MGECSCNATPPTPASPLLAAATEPLDAPFPVPAYPPADWFTEKPSWLTPDTKLSVDDEGRVAGYFYHHGQCLVHDASACPRPSPTSYAAFHQSEVITANGEPLNVGVIGDVGGHADPYASVTTAIAHYADPAKQKLIVRAYDDDVGGVILGSMVPETGTVRRPINYGDVALVRRSATSGDWRPMPPAWWRAFGIQASVVDLCEGYDCIGPTLVTRPGLPLVQRFLDAHGARAAALGGWGGIQLDEEEYRMEPAKNVTVIDLGNGATITLPNGSPMAAEAGPRPVATQAAAALAEEAPAPVEEPVDSARVASIEERVAAVEDVARQLIDAFSVRTASLPPIGAEPAPLPE